jgi:cysteine-rich repeat protein
LAAVLGGCIALFAACGDNRPDTPTPDAGMPPVDSGIDEDGCRILQLGQRDFSFNLIDQLLGLRYPVTPNLDGTKADALHIELWDSTTPDYPALAAGTYDLSTNTDLQTCQYCVWVDVDDTEDGALDTVYVATQGSLTLDQVEDPLGAVFAGHTSRIVMRRATVGDNAATTLVPDGDCVSITGVTFDTTPTPGAACESAEDCGNAMFEICDPSTNTCAEPECNFDEPCAGQNEVCLVQYRDLFEGACYQTCNPTAASASCPTNQHCVQRGIDPTNGICKYAGSGAPGSTCTIEDNTTACSGTNDCSSLSHTCAATCTFYDAHPGCTGGTQCGIFNLCEPASAGLSISFGATCGADAYQAQGCAPDGEAFRGICQGFDNQPLICQKACYGSEGCANGEFCAPRYTSGLGICLPNPVCGDGKVGEINEVCDDGNTMDGDGCSSDCKAVDVDWLCGEAETLGLDASITATTATGRDGLMSSCQSLSARAQLYTVTPPGPGRLRLHLTSPTTQTLSARTTCADSASELGCRADFGVPTDQELIIQVTDTTPTPITVMVSAMTVLEEGTFTITSEFDAEQCGDGVLEGREACDDTNTDANDGCSADCRSIEYDYYCTESPVLSTSATNTGTHVDAPTLYEASCAADDGVSLHPTQLFTFVAPTAGNLHVKLMDGTSFAVLTVRDGCGAPADAPELACRPAFLDGELDVPLTANQSITIAVISYFLDNNLGDFTLDAMFSPQ